MIINICLLIMGSIALTLGVNYLDKERYAKSWNIYIFMMGAFAFCWGVGYACMGFATNYQAAYIMRGVGLFGVLGFMISEALFLARVSGLFQKKKKLVICILYACAAVDFFLFANPAVVSFVRIGQRTCYYANWSYQRIVHSVFLGLLMLFMIAIGVRWYKREVLRRRKQLVITMFFVNFVIVLSCIPDTFMPVLGLPSVPSSGFGGILAYLVICSMASKNNAYSVSVQNLSKYIYQYVTVPVIVFSYDDTIAFMNDYGKDFFELKEEAHLSLYDLFEISRAESDMLFQKIEKGVLSQTYHMATRAGRRVCSLNFTRIEDDYEDAYCTICFVADVTRENQKLEELDSIRQQLQEEVETKEKQQQEDEYDYLTKLYTRKAGERRIIERMKKHAGCLALIDMDNLKHVNDIYGHLCGDAALRTVGEVLLSVEEDVVVARYGGDEFLCYINRPDRKTVERIIEGIRETYGTLKMEQESLKETSLSIGLCVHGEDAVYEEVFQNADRALYYVKQTGKSGYVFHADNAARGKAANASTADLQRLVKLLRGEEEYKGTFSLEYREFSKLCEFINSLGRRYEYPIQLVMITLSQRPGRDSSLEQQERTMNSMYKAIKDSLRNVDVTTRFSSAQHLVILLDADKTHVQMIVNRIFDKYRKISDDTSVDVNYDIAEFTAKE